MKKTRYGFVAVLAVMAGVAAWGQQTPSENAWSVELEGRKTWTVRYGLGDSLALAGAAIGAGQFTLDQTMAVDFTASALSIFRIKGHFDDQESSSLQSLSLFMDTENVHAVAGDFTAPNLPGFFAGSLAMKGARVDATWADGSIVGIASLLSGVRDSRSFVGQTALGERLLAAAGSSEGALYSTSLRGMGHFGLESLYVDGFTEVRLRFDSVTGLAEILERYGVAELGEAIAAFGDQKLDANKFAVVGEAEQSFLFEVEPESVVRDLLRAAIRSYNQEDAATPLSYPFVEGSNAEEEFLAALQAFSVVKVGEEEHLLSGLGWWRFYDLGRTRVVADSVVAAVSLDGRTYTPVNDPDLVGYTAAAYAEEGILEVTFPDSFFLDPDARLKISFSYSVSGSTYMLGGSVIPGSERVTMAGRALARDTEYTIDYELGLLSLLVEIGPTDPLVAEFERYRSVGGTGAYARGFYGAAMGAPLSETLSVDVYALRGVDHQGSVEHPESVKTMPNEQTVVGVRGSIALPDFSADFDLGYTNDLFPYDDNQRSRVPNLVRSIAVSGEYTFVGTDAGFVAYDGVAWDSYDTGDGLSGREVRAMAADGDAVFFGTNGGVTVVELAGVSPLDKVANWSRYGDAEGLLDVSVRALAVDDDVLWIGTDKRLFRVAIAEMADPEAWVAYANPLVEDARALCLHEGALYVGTTKGLARVDRTTGAAVRIGEAGPAVHDLASDGQTLYAARSTGLETYVHDASTGWIASGDAVLAVEAGDGEVFYGTSAGLTRVSDESVTQAGWAITAIAGAEGTLWVGSAGDRSGELLVWSLGAADAVYDVATTRIAPWNPRVYADSSPGEHTSKGWMAQASFAHEADGFSIAGSVDRVMPGFRAIDARGRSDAGGWSATSAIELGPSATLSLDHSCRLSDLGSDDALTTADSRVEFHGSFGPEISLVVDYQVEDAGRQDRGLDRDSLSYDLRLSHRLFDEVLSFTVSWGEDFSWPEERAMRRQTMLATNVSLDVTQDVRTSLSWRRPVRIASGEATGSESWSWNTRAAFDDSGFGLTATYGLDASRSLSGDARFAHAATAALTTPDFGFEGWELSPRLDLKAGHANDATSLSGRLSAQLDWVDWAARTVGSVDVSGLGSRVERWSEKLTTTLSFSGIEGLRPSLSYTATRSLTRVEGQGSKDAVTHSANGRLTWSGANGASDTFAVAGRFQDSGSFNLSLENSYAQDVTSLFAAWVPALREAKAAEATSASLRARLAADWRHDEGGRDTADWELGASADVALSSTWSLSFGLTYYGGVKTDVDMFHGLVGELTVAIEF